MDATELERRLAAIRERCAKLPEDQQARALEAFADVLTLLALPREPGESAALSISLERSPKVTYPSG
jgi:hypothetical protein